MSNGIFTFQEDFGKRWTDYMGFPLVQYAASMSGGAILPLNLPNFDLSDSSNLALRFRYDLLRSAEMRVYTAIGAVPDIPLAGPFSELNSVLNTEYLVLPMGTEIQLRNVSGAVVHASVEIFKVIN